MSAALALLVAAAAHAATTFTVCASGCNDTTIQAAVTAASPGDTIQVAAGLTPETVTVNKNLTFSGAQAGTAGTSHSGAESTVTAFNVTNVNVTIDGFTINPGSSNNGVGLKFVGGSSETVRNTIITNYGYDPAASHGTEGVSFSGTSGLAFDSDLLTSPTPTGQTQFSAAAAQDGIFGGSGTSNDVQILNTTFTSASTYPGTDIGLSVTSCTNPVISGNTSTGAATFVTLFNCTGGQVTNNNATTDPNISGSGIYIGGGDSNTTVTGNHVSGFSYGVALRNIYGDGPSTNTTITGNGLTGNYGGGISVTGTAIAALETVAAHSNDLSNNPVGVNNTSAGLVNADHNWWGTALGATIAGSKISGSGGVSYAPYYVDAAMTHLSNDDNLTSLSLSSGTLSPAFDPSVVSYTAGVSDSVTTVSVNQTAALGANAVVSGGNSLSFGANVVHVTVTSVDGTVKVYAITVTRGDTTPPVIAAHDNIAVVSATATVVTYTAPDATDNVDATAPASCSPASGSTFPLGTTTVTCSKTDAAGNPATPTTFTVTVNQAASSDASLTALSLAGATLSPAFDPATFAYTAFVDNGTTSVTVNETAAPGASATISGDSNLAVGSNPVTITVTAADGTTAKTYTVTVNRAAAAAPPLPPSTTPPATSTIRTNSDGSKSADVPSSSAGTITVASPTDSTQQTAVTWSPTTFAKPVIMTVDPTPPVAAPAFLGPANNQIVSIVVTDAATGEVIHHLDAPLEIVFANAPTGFVPAVSEDGVNFRALTEIPGPPLPDDAQDGFYRVGNDIHIVTRHLTQFAVLYKANLTMSQSGRKVQPAGSGKFGDPTRIHTGPPVVDVVGGASATGNDVGVTFYVDEQAAVFVSVLSGDRELVLGSSSTIREHRIGGKSRKSFHLVILRPGTIKLNLHIPTLVAGSKVRLAFVDYDGNKVSKTVAIK